MTHVSTSSYIFLGFGGCGVTHFGLVSKKRAKAVGVVVSEGLLAKGCVFERRLLRWVVCGKTLLEPERPGEEGPQLPTLLITVRK